MSRNKNSYKKHDKGDIHGVVGTATPEESAEISRSARLFELESQRSALKQQMILYGLTPELEAKMDRVIAGEVGLDVMLPE